MSFGGQHHAPVRLLGEPLPKAGGKCRVDVLDDDDPGFERGGKPRKNFGQGLGAAGRGSQDNQGVERLAQRR